MPAMSSNRAFFTWTFPGCPVKIDLNLGVVETIQRGLVCIGEGTPAAKQGLLLGDMVNGNTRITGFLPVADLGGELTEASRGAGRGAVGFYRMRPGETLELAEDETAAARSMFQRPGAVVLLMQPRETGSAEATFFFFERNLLCGGYLHFPFDATFLSERELRVIPSAPDELRERLRAAPLPVIPPPPANPRPAPKWRTALVMLLLAALAMVGGAVLTQTFRAPATPNNITIAPVVATPADAGNEGRIDVRAERQGKDLKITWDQALGTAGNSGTLSIIDGATHRLLPLERGQLQFGSVLYTPVSDQIRVELAISHGAVVDARGGVVVLMNAPAPPPPPGAKQEPTVRPVPTRPFVPAQSVPVARGQIDLTLPPPIEPTAPPAHLVHPPVKVPEVEMRPVEPPPPSTAEPKPVTVNFTAASPVYKATPPQPPELRAVLTQETRVRVKVQIDERGRVSKADSIPEKGVHQLLMTASVKAALGWRFTPAKLGDRPVASEMTLEFRFLRN